MSHLEIEARIGAKFENVTCKAESAYSTRARVSQQGIHEHQDTSNQTTSQNGCNLSPGLGKESQFNADMKWLHVTIVGQCRSGIFRWTVGSPGCGI